MDKIEIFKHINVRNGDITQIRTEAIVNAANPSLLGGGGVDGAIHKAAGIELLNECKTLNGCKHGEAKITKAYNLSCKYIIHTPGPIYKDGNHGEDKTLTNSYRNSLELAKKYEIKSIAFPAISTGVYNFPKEEACNIAFNCAINFMLKNNYLLEIFFILFDNHNYKIYEKKHKELINGLS